MSLCKLSYSIFKPCAWFVSTRVALNSCTRPLTVFIRIVFPMNN